MIRERLREKGVTAFEYQGDPPAAFRLHGSAAGVVRRQQPASLARRMAGRRRLARKIALGETRRAFVVDASGPPKLSDDTLR